MLRTIGLMSGTSLDGVDAAYLETDGEAIARFGPRQTLPYDPALRRALRALPAGGDIGAAKIISH
ncbi:MAG: anhydro-N-acetylmuramic acid kinase, partial [bacterium]